MKGVVSVPNNRKRSVVIARPKSKKPVQNWKTSVHMSHIHPYLGSLSWRSCANCVVAKGDQQNSIKIVYSDIENLSSPSMKTFIQSLHCPFVLVTSSEIPFWVPRTDFERNMLYNNQHLVKWYSRNPGIRHPKLVPLPLGPKWLNNWNNVNHQLQMMRQFYLKLMPTVETARSKFEDTNQHKQHLVLLKFDTKTTNNPYFKPHKGERERAMTALRKNFPYADYSRVSQEIFFDLMSQHKFVISPPGNAIDCHRTWEALMVGTIPVVLDTPLAPHAYEGLPVVVVQNWNVVTKEFLEQTYKELHDETQRSSYQWERLQHPFWRERIKKGI